MSPLNRRLSYCLYSRFLLCLPSRVYSRNPLYECLSITLITNTSIYPIKMYPLPLHLAYSDAISILDGVRRNICFHCSKFIRLFISRRRTSLSTFIPLLNAKLTSSYIYTPILLMPFLSNCFNCWKNSCDK